MSNPLAILNTGMVSCLGDSAITNAAMMRCAYSHPMPSGFYPSGSAEPYLGAFAHLPEEDKRLLGLGRLATLASIAILDAMQGKTTRLAHTPLVAAFPHPEENTQALNDAMKEGFLPALIERLPCDQFGEKSWFTPAARVGFVDAIAHAQEKIYQQGVDQVLLLLVDSLLNAHRIARYEHWEDLPRLFTPQNSNGFIPGEAAVALLVGKPKPGQTQTCITGIGYGEEPAAIGSGEVLRGNGLSAAIREAAAAAGIRVCDTDFRVSSANGEEYWFREASLAQSRTLEEKRPSHPLWHPADHIGEVGAAVGGAMVVMAHYAFEKNYAPGQRALCQISNDNHPRGAFILERIRP